MPIRATSSEVFIIIDNGIGSLAAAAQLKATFIFVICS